MTLNDHYRRKIGEYHPDKHPEHEGDLDFTLKVILAQKSRISNVKKMFQKTLTTTT
jgi:hypothetical protein